MSWDVNNLLVPADVVGAPAGDLSNRVVRFCHPTSFIGWQERLIFMLKPRGILLNKDEGAICAPRLCS